MDQPNAPFPQLAFEGGDFGTFSRAMDEPRPLFRVHGSQRDGVVEVSGVEREVGKTSDWYLTIWRSPLTLVLRDAAGKDLARGVLQTAIAHAFGMPRERPDGEWEGGGCWTVPTGDFHGAVPDVPGGVELAIVADGRDLWTRRAPPHEPRVRDVRAAVEGDTLHVAWSDDAAGEQYESEVLWTSASSPAHQEWPLGHTLVTGGRGEASAALDLLPPGEEVELRVRVHDGFNSVASEPVRVPVPDRPLRVEITPFLLGSVVPPRAPMLAGGTAWIARGRSVPYGDAYRWTLDGREIARGDRAWIEAPAEPGEHLLTLAVAWEGREASASVPLTVAPDADARKWQAFADVLRDGKHAR